MFGIPSDGIVADINGDIFWLCAWVNANEPERSAETCWGKWHCWRWALLRGSQKGWDWWAYCWWDRWRNTWYSHPRQTKISTDTSNFFLRLCFQLLWVWTKIRSSGQASAHWILLSGRLNGGGLNTSYICHCFMCYCTFGCCWINQSTRSRSPNDCIGFIFKSITKLLKFTAKGWGLTSKTKRAGIIPSRIDEPIGSVTIAWISRLYIAGGSMNLLMIVPVMNLVM